VIVSHDRHMLEMTADRLVLAAQLTPMEGEMSASGKMRVGYFTQYQVEELDRTETPLQHMTSLMKGAAQSAVRGQLGRFGFSGQKATTEVGKLSGGERARLALALITRDAPHMLILDEPTNHLDVDAREALIQALNAYSGAVVIVSHDRHMLEMTADRLVLVDSGTASEFDGSLDDYISFVLSKDPSDGGKSGGSNEPKLSKKDARRAAAQAREQGTAMRKKAKEAEAALAKLNEQRSAVDRAMFDPSTADASLTKLSMSDLMKRRAELASQIEAAELTWMEANEALEGLGA
jgi:ATP-binding cassette subfamily F protein 3